MLEDISVSQVKSIFERTGLGSITKIDKIDVGYTNDVFSIDNKFILKAARNLESDYLKREIFLGKLFKVKLPVQTILSSDTSRDLLDRDYIIYQKIQGETVYMKWHEYGESERKAMIKDICSYLKIINNTPYDKYAEEFNIDVNEHWHDQIVNKIKGDLHKIKADKLLEEDLIAGIESYVKENESVLDEQRAALTYFDPHFDNFIVRDKKIVGMLDLERTNVFSIDFVLDLVQRMVSDPKKYPSREAEKFIVDKDYADLMKWYEEFYPDLFDFKDMSTRLALYSINHDLRERITYGSVASRERLLLVIS